MRTMTGMCCVLLAMLAGFAGVAQAGEVSAVEQAVAELRVEAPKVLLHKTGPLISRVYGQPMAQGEFPEESADEFMLAHSGVFGAEAVDLLPVGLDPEIGPVQPLMIDRETGDYKFFMVRYAQHRDGVPVFRSDLRLLVRNRADFPVVLAASALRNLGDYRPNLAALPARFDPATMADTGMTEFTEPETVIWAGLEDKVVAPRLAVTFKGRDDRTDELHEAWRFVCDALTGEILHRETLIHNVDVTGSVQAMATPGAKAAFCTDEILFTYPWARVDIQGGETVYADGDGNFTIPNPGTGPVTVRSYVDGLYFAVENRAGPEETLPLEVTPPGPADFIHNEFNDDDHVLAQTNIYVSGNICRDWILHHSPAFPGVPTDYGVPTIVNRTDVYCPCNAWSSGFDGSINFCQADEFAGCPNTAWQSVLNHEYGHHIIDFTGSGQGAYGEGMSDCIAMLPVDDPNLGYGFFGDCDTGLRTADNDCQYLASGCSTCGSEIHDCGKLLSGIVWSIRNELIVTEPVDYLDILSAIVVNSIPLHSGTSINAQIAIDFLTLDDDDGNLDNGTPHYDEICAGFNDHGLECPPLLVGMIVSPQEDYLSEGPNGGPFLPGTKVYTVENLGPGSISYEVAGSQPWLTITNGSGTLVNVGDTAQVTLAINAEAETLEDGRYEDTVNFINTTDHVGDTVRAVTLNVGVPLPVYEWNMDLDPGWTTEGQWAWGVPTGGSGDHGPPDPTSGYTGSNVYGYNLYGGYENSMPETHLTSTPIDCTGLSNCTLKFRRWLGVENNTFDHAYVRVSNNGASWTTVWQNGTSDVSDTAWLVQEFDISSVADNQPTVYLRWTMGETDSGWTWGGWNIDDVQLVALGGEEPALYMLLPDGLPTYIAPGTSNSITVQIANGAESYVPGSGMLHYRYDGGAVMTAPLVLQSGNLYEATLPPASCSATPEFFFSAQGDSGTTVTSPSDAPATVYAATVGEFVTIMHDNFETDQGWVAENLGATSGDWQRGIPVDDGSWSYDPASDSDGSGQCYLTQNESGNTDVDDGAVRLTSPTIDMSNGDITIDYDYFLRLTDTAGGVDRLLVEIDSNDGAGPWTEIARHTSDGGLSWRSHTIDQFDLDDAGVTLSATTKVRFTANDADPQSVNESGLDAFVVSAFQCNAVEGFITSARSCQNHDAAGEFCLALLDHGYVEPRLSGVSDLSFDVSDLASSVSASVACDVDIDYDPDVIVVADGSDTITVQLAEPMPDGDCCTVTLTGDVVDEFAIATLAGSVNGDAVVSTVDFSGIKARFGQSTNASNFVYDINADGIINTVDSSAVKARFGNGLGLCP